MWRRTYLLSTSSVAIIVSLLCAAVAKADALVVTKAMTASTIAEIFVDEQQVRIELEIGARDLAAFSNVLPDEAYSTLTGRHESLDQRIATFLGQDWVVKADSRPLEGQLHRVTTTQRIARDEVTGEPLAEQPNDAETVVNVEWTYPLVPRPDSLSIRPPIGEEGVAATIGFVCYHDGLPVNDFRYLSSEVTLDLDWEDPWYSKFRHRNLRRQFDAPISCFLYVEPYEVRKEIIIRPRDLDSWIDLGLSDDVIPVDQQDEIKNRISEFLAERNPVSIDGKEAQGRLDRIHFIHRSLRSTGIVDPPIDLESVSATLGVIFVYPVQQLPEQVSMKCELFSSKVSSIPAVASDEAGGLPSVLTPEDPELRWKNYLTNPSTTDLLKVTSPPAEPNVSISLITLCCGVLGTVFLFSVWNRTRSGGGKPHVTLAAAIGLFAIGALCIPVARVKVANPFAQRESLADEEATSVVQTLLHNVYRSFEHHDEPTIYDRLATAIAGELLSEVYLETRKSMELKNQGGMRISVKDVQLSELESLESGRDEFLYRCRWRVSGSVGHWGHVHARENEHLAQLRIAIREGSWKIIAMEMLDQQATPANTTTPSVRRGGA